MRSTFCQGTADGVVPYRYAARARTLIPHAELVTILPTPAGTLDNTPTLGDYTRPKASTSTRPLPGKPQASRRVTTGAFLDYGPYARFAPTFDQDGSEIGRVQMGEVLWEERKRKLARSLKSLWRMKCGKKKSSWAKPE